MFEISIEYSLNTRKTDTDTLICLTHSTPFDVENNSCKKSTHWYTAIQLFLSCFICVQTFILKCDICALYRIDECYNNDIIHICWLLSQLQGWLAPALNALITAIWLVWCRICSITLIQWLLLMLNPNNCFSISNWNAPLNWSQMEVILFFLYFVFSFFYLHEWVCHQTN